MQSKEEETCTNSKPIGGDLSEDLQISVRLADCSTALEQTHNKHTKKTQRRRDAQYVRNTSTDIMCNKLSIYHSNKC